jgi:hypothetical protein
MKRQHQVLDLVLETGSSEIHPRRKRRRSCSSRKKVGIISMLKN